MTKDYQLTEKIGNGLGREVLAGEKNHHSHMELKKSTNETPSHA